MIHVTVDHAAMTDEDTEELTSSLIDVLRSKNVYKCLSSEHAVSIKEYAYGGHSLPAFYLEIKIEIEEPDMTDVPVQLVAALYLFIGKMLIEVFPNRLNGGNVWDDCYMSVDLRPMHRPSSSPS
jgi:hypothetical protein